MCVCVCVCVCVRAFVSMGLWCVHVHVCEWVCGVTVHVGVHAHSDCYNIDAYDVSACFTNCHLSLQTLESDSALSSNPAVLESGSEQVEVQPAQLAVISSNTLFLGIATEPEDRALFPQDLNTTVTFLSVVSRWEMKSCIEVLH